MGEWSGFVSDPFPPPPHSSLPAIVPFALRLEPDCCINKHFLLVKHTPSDRRKSRILRGPFEVASGFGSGSGSTLPVESAAHWLHCSGWLLPVFFVNQDVSACNLLPRSADGGLMMSSHGMLRHV